MFGLGRSKALLRRFLTWFHRDPVGPANWKIIPFDRASVVHETFPPAGQSSSGVEQRTHKPLVGGSNPSSGTNPHKRSLANMFRFKGTFNPSRAKTNW